MVYYPSEDSYLTLEVCKYAVRTIDVRKFLDLGCGSGFIGINLEKEHPFDLIIFADIDENALEIAKKEYKGKSKAIFIKSDLFSAIKTKVDLVAFNAPYLPGKREEGIDIFGGEKGNELLNRFIKEFPKYSKYAIITFSSLSNFSIPPDFKVLYSKSEKLFFEEIYSYFISA